MTGVDELIHSYGQIPQRLNSTVNREGFHKRAGKQTRELEHRKLIARHESEHGLNDLLVRVPLGAQCRDQVSGAREVAIDEERIAQQIDGALRMRVVVARPASHGGGLIVPLAGREGEDAADLQATRPGLLADEQVYRQRAHYGVPLQSGQ